MKQLVIDRFEGKYAICEDKEARYFAIEIQELPKGAKEGHVLSISEEGVLSLDLEETQRRRKRISDKQNRLFQ